MPLTPEASIPVESKKLPTLPVSPPVVEVQPLSLVLVGPYGMIALPPRMVKTLMTVSADALSFWDADLA